MFLAKLNEVVTSKNSFISDPLNFVSIGIALLINIIHWLLLFIKAKPSNTNILLHYNVVYGPDLVDKTSYLYLIPLIALGLFLLNLFLSTFFYSREKLASYFLNFAGLPVQLIFFVASLIIIRINA
jgi:hypothetical protein